MQNLGKLIFICHTYTFLGADIDYFDIIN